MQQFFRYFASYTLDADKLYIVLEGALHIHLPGRTIVVHEGECFVVQKNIERRVEAIKEAHIVVIGHNYYY